jgi:dolichol-phosphate mannosyltransferase
LAEPAFQPRKRRPSRVLVVLPAYNEAANIGRLMESIDDSLQDAGLTYDITVVDDGSSDGTAEILSNYSRMLPLTVLRHEVNQGLGATIRDGLAEALKKAGANDVIVTMDADESHLPGMVLRMVRMIREGHDVVIASRYQPGARVVGLSRMRTLMSWVASWLFRIVYPTPGLKDFTCGYRAYRAQMLKQAVSHYKGDFIQADGFQCMVEILLKLRKLDAIFGEAPMILRYDLKEGKSKMNVGKTIRKTLTLLVRRIS